MSRYALLIEYDGSSYAGWQRQKKYKSVQQVVEEAFECLLGATHELFACGRTDAGVHARGQVAHVCINKDITAFRLVSGLNAYMRDSGVSILAAAAVPDDFHARFSCIGRKYSYEILNRRPPPTLNAKTVWHVPFQLDISAMIHAAKLLEGHHDFTSFRASQCQSKSAFKTLDELSIHYIEQSEIIKIIASSRSFLHHQVRNMVGTLVLVGRGRLQPSDMIGILKAQKRSASGPTAPPHGLCFLEAKYPQDPFKKDF